MKRNVSLSTKRRQKKTALVVGEGRETEYNYFVALNGDDRARYALTVKRGRGFSPIVAVEQAIALKSGSYDDIWCVFDVEEPEKRDDVIRAAKLASEHGIKLCMSNPSIEVWFLAHFLKISRAFTNCDAVIVELNQFWSNVSTDPYDKADPKIYDRLKPFLAVAYDNAKWTRHCPQHGDTPNLYDCNSSTEMFGTVKRFLESLT